MDFKIFLGQMTSGWVLWMTYYKFLLKKCLRSCPGPSISLSRRVNWIFISFSHRISKILFVLGSLDGSWSLRYGIWMGLFFLKNNFWLIRLYCSHENTDFRAKNWTQGNLWQGVYQGKQNQVWCNLCTYLFSKTQKLDYFLITVPGWKWT